MKTIKLLIVLLFLGTTAFSPKQALHDISFLGCVDGKLKFKITNGPSGGFVSVKIVDNSNNVVACAATAPFNKNTSGSQVIFEVTQNATSCKSYTKVYVKWSKDGFVNTYKVEAKDYCTTTLPIKVHDFSAKNIGGTLTLNWKTSDAVNFSHFDIESSNDAKEFSNIGSTSFNWFSYDKDFGQYVRLKAIDLDGTFEYTKIVFVKKEEYEFVVISETPIGTLGLQNGIKTIKLRN